MRANLRFGLAENAWSKNLRPRIAAVTESAWQMALRDMPAAVT
jgi:hypothetical protein